MNWWLDEARHHDPVGFFSIYIRKLNALFEERRTEYLSMRQTGLPKNDEEMFSRSVSDSRKLRVVQHSCNVFEVQRKNNPARFRTVNVETRMCSCGFYKECGVPCHHFCAAILFLKGCPKDYIAQEHRLETLKRTYIGTANPVDKNGLQIDELQPPVETKRRGRRKENASNRLRKRGREGP